MVALQESPHQQSDTLLCTYHCGWHAATDGKITNQNGYTVRHEYGHMLSNALAVKNKMSTSSFTDKAKSEITHIARTKFGAKTGSLPSEYGDKDSFEFFAESFASLNSGNPNAYGKAMGEWLKKNKL